MNRRLTGVAVATMFLLAACGSGRQATTPAATTPAATSAAATTPSAGTPPPLAATSVDRGHVVVVLMENKPYSAIIGNAAAPYLNELARHGTSFTSLRAIAHPSQPNYVALFSGSTHGVHDDSCPQHLSGPNLAGQLQRAGLTFAGYSEGLPVTGSSACLVGAYARKHVPWADFATLTASVNRPFTAFPADYATLPTVSWVIPDLFHDMHDGTITQADSWTRAHLSRYVTWARSHHSLLVVTWDEDDHSDANRIPTFVVGAGVPAATVDAPVTLYSVLRAIEDRYGLSRLGGAATAPSLGLP